jgi:hypothetical protein
MDLSFIITLMLNKHFLGPQSLELVGIFFLVKTVSLFLEEREGAETYFEGLLFSDYYFPSRLTTTILRREM